VTETTAPAVFDPDLIDDVGAAHDLPAATLCKHLVAVQELAAHHDGVDALVYDWRTSSGSDPLFERTSDRWELVVDAGVWRDFGDRLDLDDGALRAVMAVHDRQFRRFAAEREETPGLGEPMVLARE
jgi:hypothetical protein